MLRGDELSQVLCVGRRDYHFGRCGSERKSLRGDDHVDVERLRFRGWAPLLAGLRPEIGCMRRALSESGRYRPGVALTNASSLPMLKAF